MGDSAGCGCHELISRWSIHYDFAESLVEAPINGYKGGGGGGGGGGGTPMELVLAHLRPVSRCWSSGQSKK